MSTETAIHGLTHHCDDQDCHVPGFVATLQSMTKMRESVRNAACICTPFSVAPIGRLAHRFECSQHWKRIESALAAERAPQPASSEREGQR